MRAHWSFDFLRRVLAIGISLPFLCAAAWSADRDYQLRPGDKLELKVVSLPELGQRTTIDVDGKASFPLVGLIKVGGMSLSELQAALRSTLPLKIFYKRSPEGKKIPYVADAEEITIEISEYRPIFVSGDVPRPGEQPYRPGLRVRHALAVAGGQDLLSLRLGSGILGIFDYQGNRDTLLTELAQERARNWRINAELNGQPTGTSEDLAGQLSGIAGQNATAIAQLEAEQLSTRLGDWQRQSEFLKTSVSQATNRVKVLSTLFQNESEGGVADTQEYDRMKSLLEKNLTSSNRVTESRRAMLISATRALQTGAQLSVAEREKEERTRALRRESDQRRLDLMKDLADSQLKLVSLKSRIDVNERKFAFLNGARDQFVGNKGVTPNIVINREADDGQQKIKANLDTVLLPGDVVEVTLAREIEFGIPTR